MDEIGKLVKDYRDGNAGALDLWQRVRWLADKEGRAFFERCGSPARFDLEDLRQAGFIAMLRAAADYDPEAEEASFYGFFKNRLKSEFLRAANGARTEKALRDPANTALSLDAPEEDPDGGDPRTILDSVPDAVDPYIDADARIYAEQLRTALEEALKTLPERTARRVYGHFLELRSLADLADAEGVSFQAIGASVSEGLKRLRRGKARQILAPYEEIREAAAYRHSSAASFQRTHTSTTERAALDHADALDAIAELEAAEREILRRFSFTGRK